MEHEASGRITRLPQNVAAQIDSSTVVNTLTDVIFGLVENALDARASKIRISLDFTRGSCTVEDNGHGILPDEFRATGGLGHLHHTSKQQTDREAELHGGNGVFLSHLAGLSLLTIISKHDHYRSHNSLTFHRYNVVARHLPVSRSQEILGPSGTRVIVKDLFGDMPVRVKQRALLADSTSPFASEKHLLKTGLVSLVLSWPYAVHIKVENVSEPSGGYSLGKMNTRESTAARRPRSSIGGRELAAVLAQAGFVAANASSSFVPASASVQGIMINGCISTRPAPNKNTQFLSIGIRPCSSTVLHDDLYGAVNRVFEASDFGMDTTDSDDYSTRNEDRGIHKRRHQATRRKVDRWPMFYLCISIEPEPSCLDSSRMPLPIGQAVLQKLIRVLEALASGWLESHQFRPRKRKATTSVSTSQQTLESWTKSSEFPRPMAPIEVSTSTTYTQTANSCNSQPKIGPSMTSDLAPILTQPGHSHMIPLRQLNFSEWSRIKSGRNAYYDRVWMPQQTNLAFLPPLRDSESTSLETKVAVESICVGDFTISAEAVIHDEAKALGKAHPAIDSDQGAANPNKHLVWRDPQSRDSIVLDARTGALVPERASVANGDNAIQDDIRHGRDTTDFSDPVPIPASTLSATAKHWFSEFFQDWEHSRFAMQAEQTVRAIAHAELYKVSTDTPSWVHSHANIDSRLSKSALSQAQVISQVDRKFILIKVSTEPSSDMQTCGGPDPMLVVVDQHAASERCILESLFTQMCEPAAASTTCSLEPTSCLGLRSRISTSQLTKTIQISISSTEREMFERHASRFADWGILYNLVSDAGDGISKQSSAKLIVLTLPDGISARCVADPKLIIDILRTEIWAQEGSGARHALPKAMEAVEEHSWLYQIGSCPRGILELLNSRACRSAIMFNDELSMDQCTSLIGQLSRCAFPFMCAHGRVSMVPLVRFDNGDKASFEGVRGGLAAPFKETSDFSSRKDDFAVAMQTWKARRDCTLS